MLKVHLVNTAKKVIPQNIRVAIRKMRLDRKYRAQAAALPSSAPSVYCPIAQEEFKTFVKDGIHLVTPSNGAKGRQRIVWQYLENETRIFTDNVRLLHTAPELAFLERFRQQANLDYVAGDKMVDGYSNQDGILDIDLTDLTFEDNSFDYLLSNHVLEHIPDDRKAMSEIFRVLKKGGEAILTVPINESLSETLEDDSIVTPKDRQKHFGQWDHVRWYSIDIKDRLESVGFSVELIRYGVQFSEAEYNRLGLNKNFIIVAKKPA